MTDFTVRVRFRIPPGDRLGMEADEVTYVPSRGKPVLLKAAESGEHISKTDWLLAISEGWQSAEEAESAASDLTDALRTALSRFGVGADLGRRAPQSFMFRAGLEMVANMADRRVLNDEHGAMVFATHLKPMFARVGNATVVRTLQPERWKKAFIFALDSGHVLGERERAAFDLYTGAHLVRESQDARFILLFAAIETLIDEGPRPESVRQLVDEFLARTKAADLPEDEKQSLVGSLKWLRSYSIRQAGRALVREQLGARQYGDVSAEKFFDRCYELRNRLLHGKLPLPSRQEVGQLAAPLEMMVGHLIAGPIRDLDV
ncbi:MAG: hypothetical protein ACYSWU_17015 [Planctomycetota bacterium]